MASRSGARRRKKKQQDNKRHKEEQEQEQQQQPDNGERKMKHPYLTAAKILKDLAAMHAELARLPSALAGMFAPDVQQPPMRSCSVVFGRGDYEFLEMTTGDCRAPFSMSGLRRLLTSMVGCSIPGGVAQRRCHVCGERVGTPHPHLMGKFVEQWSAAMFVYVLCTRTRCIEALRGPCIITIAVGLDTAVVKDTEQSTSFSFTIPLSQFLQQPPLLFPSSLSS